MKALRKLYDGPNGLQLVRDMPIPKPGPGQVRIKVIYAAICGTDLHIRDDEYPVHPPVTIGHEYSGIIDALGEGVDNLSVGDHVVSLTAAGYCGKCELCTRGLHMLCNEKKGLASAVDGAFAEFLVYPADRVFSIRKDLSMKAAALTEPLACAVRAVLERTTLRAGDYVYVSGPGAIGQFVAQLARLCGTFVTVGGTGVDVDRLALAKELGAEDVVDITGEDAVEHAINFTNGRMYDVAFECSGAPKAIDTCIDVLKKTGHYQQVGLFGKPVLVDLDRILFKEVDISTSFASERTTWVRTLTLIEKGLLNIEPLCSYVMVLEDWEEAMRKAERKEGYKVLFQLNPEE